MRWPKSFALVHGGLAVNDLPATRKEIEAKLDPEWVAKYGDAAWAAALALIGVTAPTGR